MADVEEVTSEKVTRDHVERRISDWRDRVAVLYSNVLAWLPAGWRPGQEGTTVMNEEMMRKSGVAVHRLPVLNLVAEGGDTARIEPRALWVIGANGRLDMYVREKHFLLVDKAPQFSPPEWMYSNIRNRRDLEPFDRTALARMLNEAAS